MANEARYHYPEGDSEADPVTPQGFKISVFDGQFEILDSTIDSGEAKSTIDLNADAAGYPHRFRRGDAVQAIVKDKRGVLQAGNFVIKAERLNTDQGVWEYRLKGASDKGWVRDGNLSRVV
ncbi:hypothetical protein LTR15_012144 [Elasticomyces elasticus]|nr:hypothetical protein LTR15_012144 [Elasticomyces elasticus]